MKQYAEHGRVGLCHRLRGDEMYRRVFSGGYPYFKNGLIVMSDSINPIYSYGKNYENEKDKFALFVWTTEKDESKIEKLFEDMLGRLTSEQIQKVSNEGSFIYIN